MLEALRGGSVLETLDLGANGLTGAGFEQLLPELAAFPGLRTLEVIVDCRNPSLFPAIPRGYRVVVYVFVLLSSHCFFGMEIIKKLAFIFL